MLSAVVRDCGKLKKVDGGAVAQLGARLDGIEEVVGSNPIGSTKQIPIPSNSAEIDVFPSKTAYFEGTVGSPWESLGV